MFKSLPVRFLMALLLWIAPSSMPDIVVFTNRLVIADSDATFEGRDIVIDGASAAFRHI